MFRVSCYNPTRTFRPVRSYSDAYDQAVWVLTRGIDNGSYIETAEQAVIEKWENGKWTHHDLFDRDEFKS